MSNFEFSCTFSKFFPMRFQWDNFQVLIIYRSEVSYIDIRLYKVEAPIVNHVQ